VAPVAYPVVVGGNFSTDPGEHPFRDHKSLLIKGLPRGARIGKPCPKRWLTKGTGEAKIHNRY